MLWKICWKGFIKNSYIDILDFNQLSSKSHTTLHINLTFWTTSTSVSLERHMQGRNVKIQKGGRNLE